MSKSTSSKTHIKSPSHPPAANLDEPSPLLAWGRNPPMRLACLIALGVIALCMVGGVFWMSGQDVLWPKDSFSDVNTLMAAEDFAQNGFIPLRFLPVHYVPSVGAKPNYYTHYPPLPDLVCGLVQACGGRSLAAQRIVCGLFGVAGWLLLSWAVWRRLGPLAAALGLAFVATSGFFWSYGVSVHQHGFNIFFVGLFLALFLKATDDEKPAWWLWAACWAALFLESWTSFEFILYPQAFAWLYVLGTRQFRKRWIVLLVLGTAPFAGVGLHFLQNAWAIGWQAARGDFLGIDQYQEGYWDKVARVSGLIRHNIFDCFGWGWVLLPAAASALLAGLALDRPAAPGWRRTAGAILALAATLVVLVIALLIFGLMRRDLDAYGSRRGPDPFADMTTLAFLATILYVGAAVLLWPPAGAARKALVATGALAVAPLAWLIGMASHAHHPHTVNQLMPIGAAAFGGLAAMAGLRVFAARSSLPTRLVAAGGVLLLVCVAIGSAGELDRRLRPLGPQPLAQTTFARALGPEAFGEGHAVLSNGMPEALVGYFLRNSSQLCQLRDADPNYFQRPDSVRGMVFPRDFHRLQQNVGKGWSYDRYLFFWPDEGQMPLFNFLRTHCRGKALLLPLHGRPVPIAFLFDLTPLQAPVEEWKPLEEPFLGRQAQMQFEPWEVPGFLQRLLDLWSPPKR